MERATYTIAELVALLGVDRSTVYRRISDGTIPSIRIGRRVLVPREPIDRLLRAGSEA